MLHITNGAGWSDRAILARLQGDVAAWRWNPFQRRLNAAGTPR
jgi:hypothetical protein